MLEKFENIRLKPNKERYIPGRNNHMFLLAWSSVYDYDCYSSSGFLPTGGWWYEYVSQKSADPAEQCVRSVWPGPAGYSC